MMHYEVRIARAPADSARRAGEIIMTCETEPEAYYFMALAHRLPAMRGCTLEVVRVHAEPFRVCTLSEAA